MRTIALIAVIWIASAAIAQEGEVPSLPPIDLSLEAPALPIDLSLEAPTLLAVGMVPNSDVFFYLEFRTVLPRVSILALAERISDPALNHR